MLILFLAVFLSAVFVADVAGQTASFPLDARASFLRAAGDSQAPPLVVDLAQIGVAPGAWVRIGTEGAFSYVNGGADTGHTVLAVFSSSSTLAGSTVQQRVVDAIAAGGGFASSPTYNGSLATDVPQDFLVSRTFYGTSTEVEVPAGATHLFLGVHDTLYFDNSDPNGDFGAFVTVLPQPQLPGTGEHVDLLTTASGGPVDVADVQPAVAGSTIVATIRDPLGLREGDLFLFVLASEATGVPIVPVLSGVWTNPIFVARVGIVGAGPDWVDTWSAPTPSGYAGITLVVQGGLWTAAARNGFYQTTHAHQFELQ